MNKIVRDHYPVANLPEDLKEGLLETGTVRVIIDEVDDAAYLEAKAKLKALAEQYWVTRHNERKPSTPAEMIELLELYRAVNPERITSDEAVAQIRELRDEWDD